MTTCLDSVVTVKGVVTALTLAALAGCGGSSASDGGAKDLTKPRPDQTMVEPEDMATAEDDLTMPEVPDDLSVVPDLVKPPDMATAPAATVKVGANNSLTFAPAQVTIKVNDTVLWQWESGGHNVVAAGGSFCNDNDMNCNMAPVKNAGFTYRHKFTQLGAFPYFCAPHVGAGMSGTVTVK